MAFPVGDWEREKRENVRFCLYFRRKENLVKCGCKISKSSPGAPWRNQYWKNNLKPTREEF